MFLRLLLFLLSTLLCTSARAQKAGTDYAFLFYTADYTNGWTDLPETKARLPELAAELKNNYNFKVETYGDLNLAKLKARLAEINNRPFGPNDQVLFFFTGHGYYQSGSDNGYLIPTDGPHEWNYGDGWLGYDKLREYLSGNRAKHLLVAFDACYSGSFGRRTMGKPGPPPWDQDADCNTINRNSLRFKSRLFFSSGNKTERVPAQSEFLRRWLQCLRDLPQNGQYVLSDDDLRGYVNSVRSSSPEDGTFRGHASSGKFVFLHRDACAPREDPLVAADNAHWAGVQQARTVGKVKEHIDLFKKCLHYQEALQLLSGGATVRADSISPIPTVLTKGMVNIPGGSFQMGDTFGEGEEDETPVHIVVVDPFQMGRYEVTFAEYDRFTTLTGKKQADDVWGRGQQPVINVSWFDAISYCNWLSDREGFVTVYRLADRQKHIRWEKSGYSMELDEDEGIEINWNNNGYRLPTEAEWEFAASYKDGSTKARFGNGKATIRPTEANFNASVGYRKKYSEIGLYREKTLTVGSLNCPNKLDIHDLTGNAWEWCSDWYSENYYREYKGRSNPTGPAIGVDRVRRGGGWYLRPLVCRAAARKKGRPDQYYNFLGFRLARSPSE